MNRNQLFTVFFVLFFVCPCKGQITEKELIRDPKTNCLYFARNEKRTLVDEEVITVKLKSGVNTLDKDFKVIQSNRLGYADLQVPTDVKVEHYGAKLKESDMFEGVYYNTYLEMDLYPNDYNFGIQNSDYYHYINMQDAWDYSTGSPTVKVAVIDSKVAFGHPDLNGNLLEPSGWTFGGSVGPDEHGTLVAGVIGAKTNNSIGVSGVAGGNNSHGVTVMPYNISEIGLDGELHLRSYQVDDAILAAIDAGVKVINMSIGNSGSHVGDYPYWDAAIEDAYSNGIVLVAGSGNDNLSSIDYPANHPKVIAVGAGDTSIGRHFFSNYGSGLELVAPGANIYSTTINSSGGYSYDMVLGTSFSAPIVSGVVALLFSVKPNLTPGEIRKILRKTATKYGGYTYDSNGFNSQIGYGIINARAALSLSLSSISGPIVASSSAVYSIENLSQDFTVVWSLSDSYYNQNCLQQNTPSTNECTITPVSSHDMTNATLTAIIKKDNIPVDTLTKTGMYAHVGFKGHYTSGNLSGDINYTHTFNVKTNATTYITSPNFLGATVSYSSSGATPSIWTFSPTYGNITMVTTNTSAPVVINVDDVCGNHYTLYAFPQSYSINVSYENNCIDITLNDNDDSSRDLSFDQPWTLEIRNAVTGELVFSQSSTSRTESISTSGWPKGIYIIKVTIDKEEHTEKIIVK